MEGDHMSSIIERQWLPKVGDLTPPRALPRRSFLRRIGLGAAALVPGTALLNATSKAFGDEDGNGITKGDAAMLRFAAAAEILETDFWVQYNELGGIQDSEEPSGTGNPAYTNALKVLDGPANLDRFRTLPGSTATGSSGKRRLTNLTQLTLDTSWWTRYRSRANNPDLDPNFVFPQAVPTLFQGQHTAIPRTDNDVNHPKFLQAIANTAAFHFPTIEQGGNSLYPSMAQRATSVEVLRILISIGPTETMHFQTWSDKAGNAPPLTAVDPVTGVSVTFPDLNSPPFGGQNFQTNLIMPEPCPFISRNLPVCSIIRPTNTNGIAMGVVKFLTDMGLFRGQSPAFFSLLHQLAQQADAAQRED